MSDLVFRRINGRIIPIRKKDITFNKSEAKGLGAVATGGAISIASSLYAAKQIRKASFSFGRAANLRGAAHLASKGSSVRSALNLKSAASTIIGRKLTRKGFGILLAGTVIGAGIAGYGAKRALGNKKLTDEKRNTVIGATGSVVAGLGFLAFGRTTKMAHLSRFMKVKNPRETVNQAFKIYSENGIKKSYSTIKRYSSSIFSFGKSVKAQNAKAANSAYSPFAFKNIKKGKWVDPNQGRLF